MFLLQLLIYSHSCLFFSGWEAGSFCCFGKNIIGKKKPGKLGKKVIDVSVKSGETIQQTIPLTIQHTIP